ncbi:MAG TPA: hypothetical protein PK711_02310 [Bacteroidales bacterium]|nr:hypothetical protein [Bacteroidales bacterium]HRZ20244.1 hypothetical protein [Bacteroidales bacterium]
MNDGISSFFTARVIIPLLVALAALVLVSNLDKKFRNPYYVKKNSYTGGIIVRGIPIPLVNKGGKIPALSREQMEAIKAALGDDVNMKKIQKNKRWYKHPALRSFLIVVTCLGFVVCFSEVQAAFKQTFG